MGRLALKYRDPAWVTKCPAGWAQRYRRGTLVSASLRSAPFRIAEAKTRDLFCWAHTPSTGDTIVELGAEYGTETLFLSRMVGPTGRVIAVEAHPGTYAGLCEMVRINRLANVTTVHAAVGAQTGTTTITDGDAVSNTSGQGEVEVPALTFVDVLENHGVDQVDMLKMNIEGAELPVLASLTPKVAARIKHVVVSCHDFRADQGHGEFYRTGAAVESHLDRLGFTVSRRTSASHSWVRDYRYAERTVRSTALAAPDRRTPSTTSGAESA